MRLIIYPYNILSKTATELAKAFNTKKVFPDKAYSCKDQDIILNWGNSTVPVWNLPPAERLINSPPNVKLVANKLLTFEVLQRENVPIPPFTSNPSKVKEWIENGKIVVERNKLSGHSGEGIILLDNYDAERKYSAPLYTLYIKKKHEYRVHVFHGEVIDVVQKKLKQGAGIVKNKQIRNLAGGWIYARTDIEVPQEVLDVAKAAMKATGLTLGAVDIGWNEHHKAAIVYEINSAPGLYGTTMYNYIRSISRFYGLSYNLDGIESINIDDNAMFDEISDVIEDKLDKKDEDTVDKIISTSSSSSWYSFHF